MNNISDYEVKKIIAEEIYKNLNEDDSAFKNVAKETGKRVLGYAGIIALLKLFGVSVLSMGPGALTLLGTGILLSLGKVMKKTYNVSKDIEKIEYMEIPSDKDSVMKYLEKVSKNREDSRILMINSQKLFNESLNKYNTVFNESLTWEEILQDQDVRKLNISDKDSFEVYDGNKKKTYSYKYNPNKDFNDRYNLSNENKKSNKSTITEDSSQNQNDKEGAKKLVVSAAIAYIRNYQNFAKCNALIKETQEKYSSVIGVHQSIDAYKNKSKNGVLKNISKNIAKKIGINADNKNSQANNSYTKKSTSNFKKIGVSKRNFTDNDGTKHSMICNIFQTRDNKYFAVLNTDDNGYARQAPNGVFGSSKIEYLRDSDNKPKYINIKTIGIIPKCILLEPFKEEEIN